jgi:hypothetical protein
LFWNPAAEFGPKIVVANHVQQELEWGGKEGGTGVLAARVADRHMSRLEEIVRQKTKRKSQIILGTVARIDHGRGRALVVVISIHCEEVRADRCPVLCGVFLVNGNGGRW